MSRLVVTTTSPTHNLTTSLSVQVRPRSVLHRSDSLTRAVLGLAEDGPATQSDKY